MRHIFAKITPRGVTQLYTKIHSSRTLKLLLLFTDRFAGMTGLKFRIFFRTKNIYG